MPRFDEPRLTRNGAEVCAELGIVVPEQPPIPPLVEPDPMPPVLDPVESYLVAVAHPRIQVLGNYLQAGWQAARPGTWLRAEAYERLCGVAESLPERFGLCVFDAWRPLDLQAELFDAAYANPLLPPGFVSPPDADPRTPPPHLTGGTVDCSLTVDDIPLGLGAGFDDFTDLARADALEVYPGADRELRRMLYWAMRAAGFVVLDCEWWHFEFGTRRWAGICGEAPLFGPIDTDPGVPTVTIESEGALPTVADTDERGRPTGLVESSGSSSGDVTTPTARRWFSREPQA